MIGLFVSDYCYDCPEFEADVEKHNLITNEKKITQTNICCKHSVRCAGIVEYLKTQTKKSEDD